MPITATAGMPEHINDEATDENLNATTWQAADSLGDIRIEAARVGLKDAAAQTACSLLMVGAWAVQQGKANLLQEVSIHLKRITEAAGADIVQSAFI